MKKVILLLVVVVMNTTFVMAKNPKPVEDFPRAMKEISSFFNYKFPKKIGRIFELSLFIARIFQFYPFLNFLVGLEFFPNRVFRM